MNHFDLGTEVELVPYPQRPIATAYKLQFVGVMNSLEVTLWYTFGNWRPILLASGMSMFSESGRYYNPFDPVEAAWRVVN